MYVGGGPSEEMLSAMSVTFGMKYENASAFNNSQLMRNSAICGDIWRSVRMGVGHVSLWYGGDAI
jgi:hypothetical protein